MFLFAFIGWGLPPLCESRRDVFLILVLWKWVYLKALKIICGKKYDTFCSKCCCCCCCSHRTGPFTHTPDVFMGLSWVGNMHSAGFHSEENETGGKENTQSCFGLQRFFPISRKTSESSLEVKAIKKKNIINTCVTVSLLFGCWF